MSNIDPGTIPVFFHIPRCSGTYTISLMYEFLRIYLNAVKHPENSKTARTILVHHEGKIILRALCNDPDGYVYDNVNFKPIPNFSTGFFLEGENISNIKNMYIHSITVEPAGFKQYETLLKPFNKIKKFIIIRTPITRAFSLYTYSKSSKSKHEHIHKKFQDITFEEYITSKKFESEWIIRSFLGGYTGVVTEKEYNSVLEILSTFEVFDIKEGEVRVSSIFEKYRGLSVKDINKPSYERAQQSRNSSSPIEYTIEKLTEETKKTFLERTKWEYKLYNFFINETK
jgi:hypothetical protein